MAVDVGTVRVGLALTDPGKVVVTPFDTIEAGDTDADGWAGDLAHRLVGIARAQQVDTIVVGLPRSLAGRHTASTALAERVIDAVRAAAHAAGGRGGGAAGAADDAGGPGAAGAADDAGGPVGPGAVDATQDIGGGADGAGGDAPPIAVHAWDERLTSVEAERMLVDAGRGRRDRRRSRDRIAAAIILQSWLQARAASAARRP